MNFTSSLKKTDTKLVLVTCYDFSFASLLNRSSVDGILVGDSVAMVCHGYPSTLSATVEMIAIHTAAVRRGAPDKFIIGDLPFLSYRNGISVAVESAGELMRAGANAVKLEGLDGHEEVISHLVKSGIPVMGHLGMMPQHVNEFGGYKIQGNTVDGARTIIEEAAKLEELGCFSVVLECIPPNVGKKISEGVRIPTIGIGAGPHTDGQILVLNDLLGFGLGTPPKFVRQYMNGAELVHDALESYAMDVRGGMFPLQTESYSSLLQLESH